MTGQDDRKGFYFLGDDLALDFLNTRPVENGQLRELLPDFRVLLRWFSAAGLVGADRGRAILNQSTGLEQQAALEQIRKFRERLRSAIAALETTGKVSEGAIREVNQHLEQHPIGIRLAKEGGRVVKERRFSPAKPADLIGLVASLAADLFAGRELARVRRCHSCVLHFYDTTKSRTRRWCSMKICGNRAKVAKYAARTRQH